MHGCNLAPRFASEGTTIKRHTLCDGVPRRVAEEANGGHQLPYTPEDTTRT